MQLIEKMASIWILVENANEANASQTGNIAFRPEEYLKGQGVDTIYCTPWYHLRSVAK